MQFETMQKAMIARFEASARQDGLRANSQESFRQWRYETRMLLCSLLGLSDTTGLPIPEVQETERVVCDGFVRVRLLVHTAPHVVMPVYLLLPDGLVAGERRPVVIAPHGHDSHGKDAVAGNARNQAIADVIERYHYDYGAQLARAGYIVFCPDACGFGERREKARQSADPEKMLDGSCALINHMALPLGQTVTGLWVYDLMRLVDYILSTPYCLEGRIGCVGLSGGALQTLWLGALDDRLHCMVVSGYFYGVMQSLLVMCGNCSCNYVPHLWEHVDMGDLGALAAPTPMLIVTGDQDPLNGRDGLGNVLPQVAIAAEAYALTGASDRLEHHIFHGEHRWEDARVLPFLQAHLGSVSPCNAM